MDASSIQAVREKLQEFQDGYSRRDLTRLNEFSALFVQGDDAEVIGTGAIEPGGDEWCLGTEAISGLIENDWEGWGDLVLDVSEARIHVLGDAAWLATTGMVTMALDPSETYRDYLSYINEVSGDEHLDPRQRLLEIIRGGSNTLFEGEQGKQFTWPLRFTAVLVRQAGNWLFHQVQFSFATTRFPDVRNV